MAERESRNDEYDALENRTEQSFKTKDGERRFHGFFDPDKTQSVPMWVCKEGEHEIDIIPYLTGPNDPKVAEGGMNYLLDIYIHRNVGPRDLQFVCLERNYEQRCPICEHINKLRKNPPEGERQLKQHEDLLKSLTPTRRVVYNIVCYDQNEEKKGVQLWDVSHWLMEAKLQAISKRKGGGRVVYSHPREGRSVLFERQGSGQRNTQYVGHRFEPRNYDIPKEWLRDTIAPDTLIHIPTYEEVEEAFWDDTDPEQEDKETIHARHEEPPSPRQHEQDGGDSPRRSRPEREPEEDAPSPRRRGREPEPDESPSPRRRSASWEPESGSGEDATTKCPVAGGRFGHDTDKYEDCETCQHWEPCTKAKEDSERAEEREPDDAPAPRRSRGPEPEEDAPSPRRRGREPEPDNAPAPRRRLSHVSGDEDPPSPRRRGREPEPDNAPAPRKRGRDDEDPPPARRRRE